MTPPETHAPLALAAMAAASAGVVAILQHQQRRIPVHALLRRQVAEGAFGELIQSGFTFDFPMTNRPGPLDVPHWWRSTATGGGWLRSWNAHGIDLVRYMLGEFAAVSGRVHADHARGMSADDSYISGEFRRRACRHARDRGSGTLSARGALDQHRISLAERLTLLQEPRARRPVGSS